MASTFSKPDAVSISAITSVRSFACFIVGRFETIRISVAYTSSNVKIVGTHVGVAIGEDGTRTSFEKQEFEVDMPNPNDDKNGHARDQTWAQLTKRREVLSEVYLYLDLECDEQRRGLIQTHLDECSPCLREYGIEQEVKALVARCCGNDRAPEALRERLRQKIASLVDRENVS